jgi:Pvc16 N-terminal domain
VIHEVDSALRTLIERETGTRDVEVVFDAPTREWAGRRNSPTIDVYLYDIREDMRRKERGLINEYDERNLRVVARHLPPRYFKLSYLVTAWTQRPEDEHRLLSSLLYCFLRFDALPDEVLTGPLLALGVPVPVTVALPPPEDRAFADVWSALGGELKPSIDLVISAPVDSGQRYEAGPPVEVPPRLSIGGSDGWPGMERASGKAADRLRGPAVRAAAERAEAEAEDAEKGPVRPVPRRRTTRKSGS